MASDEVLIDPPDAQKTLEWITVLSAVGLDYRLARDARDWVIHVSTADEARVRAELDAYERESAEWPALLRDGPPGWSVGTGTWSAAWAGGFLVAFYAWLGPYRAGSSVLRAACGDSARMLAGEWWRPITALTIHSSASHLAGNTICLVLMGYAVCRTVGRGLGWLLVLVGGVAGNVATGLLRPEHLSVGASTACFSALGILSAHRAVALARRVDDAARIGRRTWLPLVAGLGMLLLTGTGPRTDVSAHVLGFLAGMTAALPFSWVGVDWVPDWVQRALQLLCLAVIGVAWRAALSAA